MELPDDPKTLEQRADAELARGAFEEAARLYDRLVRLGVADEYIWCHAGDAFCGLEEYVCARHAYEQALERAPDRPELHINLARALHALGDADGAATHLEFAAAHGLTREALLRLAVIAPGVPRYDLPRVLEVRRAFGTLFDSAAPDQEAPPPVLDRKPGDRIHVAYLSAHFDQPAYMGPVWGLINRHDRTHFRVTLLSDASVALPIPDYLPCAGDRFRVVSDLDDAALARAIAEEGIDILVDLSGYSHQKRLSLFGRRAAPRVITWFNMYATSGLPGIDYIIGDDHVIRPGEELFYSEKVLRLPQSYLTFQGWDDRPDPVPPPCASGKPFTLGSLVSLYKITPCVLDAWAEIMRRAPSVHLMLGNSGMKSPRNRDYILQQFQSRGVHAARITLRGPAAHAAYLRYYEAIDVALDAFPYSGGTTTMEAIWQGVPVLTQAGDRWAARTTGSILLDTHLGDYCCTDARDYVERAVALALDPDAPERLAALRRAMRGRLRTCRALDCAALARNMERLYRLALVGSAGTVPGP